MNTLTVLPDHLMSALEFSGDVHHISPKAIEFGSTVSSYQLSRTHNEGDLTLITFPGAYTDGTVLTGAFEIANSRVIADTWGREDFLVTVTFALAGEQPAVVVELIPEDNWDVAEALEGLALDYPVLDDDEYMRVVQELTEAALEDWLIPDLRCELERRAGDAVVETDNATLVELYRSWCELTGTYHNLEGRDLYVPVSDFNALTDYAESLVLA